MRPGSRIRRQARAGRGPRARSAREGATTTRGPFPRWPLSGRSPPSPGVGHQARTARDWPGPGGQGQDGQRPRRGRVPTGHARGRFRVFAPGEATRADFSRGTGAPEGQRRARSRARSDRGGPRPRACRVGQGRRAEQANPQGWPAQRRRRGEARAARAPQAATGSSPWPRGSSSLASEAGEPAGLACAAAAARRSSGGSSAESGDGRSPWPRA